MVDEAEPTRVSSAVPSASADAGETATLAAPPPTGAAARKRRGASAAVAGVEARPGGPTSEGARERPTHDDRDAPEQEAWSAPLLDEPTVGLTLSDRIRHGGGFDAPPAPTEPPARRKVDGAAAAEAIAAGIRAHDRTLGMGNPEQTRIGHAVQIAGRETGVPSRTRFRVTLNLDKAGALLGVKLVSASAGSEAVWSQFLATVRADLSSSPIPLGPDAKIAGAVVVVDAMLIHAFPTGTDQRVIMGECPKMPVVGGEAQSHFQNNMGGTLFGLPANGLCPLYTYDPESSKTIQVRTTIQTVLPGMAPPPMDALGPNKPEVRRIPSVQEMGIWLLKKLIGE